MSNKKLLQIQQYTEYCKQGLSQTQVAKLKGVSKQRINQILKKLGLIDLYKDAKPFKKCKACGKKIRSALTYCTDCNPKNIKQYCKICGKELFPGKRQKGYCLYHAPNRHRIGTCYICGNYGPLVAHNSCRRCYQRVMRRLNYSTPFEKCRNIIDFNKELEVMNKIQKKNVLTTK